MTGTFPRMHLSSTEVYNDFSLRYLSHFSSSSAFILTQTEAWQEKHDRIRQRDSAKQRSMYFPLPSLKDVFKKMQGFATHKYISSAKQTGKAVTFAGVLLN